MIDFDKYNNSINNYYNTKVENTNEKENTIILIKNIAYKFLLVLSSALEVLIVINLKLIQHFMNKIK